MLAIFDCDRQDQLAHAIYTMTLFRDDYCVSCLQQDVAINAVDASQLAVEHYDVEPCYGSVSYC
jgi:hypothetical protein